MAELYPELSSTERAKKIGEGAGQLELMLMQMQMKERENAANLQFGQGGAIDRTNLAQERIAGMQYGPDGSADRGFAQEDRRTNAMAPAYAGEGALAQARASEQIQETGYNKIFSDKMIGKMGASTDVAAPKKKFVPLQFKGYDELSAELDKEQNPTPWSPSGNKYLDWGMRRMSDVTAYPGKIIGRRAGQLAMADFWNR